MKKFLFIIAIFFAYALRAFAADVFIVAPETINKGQQFSVYLNLNTDGVLINSFDISMSYPKNLVSFEGYKEEGSIKKLWLLHPTEESGDTIHLSGVIPGGVNGVYDPDKNGLQAIPIVQLLFQARDDGAGLFTIIHSDILKNDGKGTELSHEVKNASIVIAFKAPSTDQKVTSIDTPDTEPPMPFTIEYIPAGFFSETPSMIIFSTQDTGSGVEEYQSYLFGSWRTVVSPLPTPKALLEREVVVRAIDFNGNMRESRIDIPGLLSVTQLIIIILLCIICYFAFFVLKRRR